MRLFDFRFKKHAWRYLFQCGLATAAVCLVLLALDALKHTAIIASLGASAFIAFAMPGSRLSAPQYLIGGYVVGGLVGGAFRLLADSQLVAGWALSGPRADILFGALAVGVAIFLMVLTNTEHPPAAGLALGLLLNEWDGSTLVVVFVGIVLLSLSQQLLRPWLIDLV